MAKRIISFIAFILILLMIAGCSAKQTISVETQNAVDTITEGILLGFNTSNYAKFTERFDQTMKEGLPESKFRVVNTDIKGRIGNYVSKDLLLLKQRTSIKYLSTKGNLIKKLMMLLLGLL